MTVSVCGEKLREILSLQRAGGGADWTVHVEFQVITLRVFFCHGHCGLAILIARCLLRVPFLFSYSQTWRRAGHGKVDVGWQEDGKLETKRDESWRLTHGKERGLPLRYPKVD